MRGNSASLFAFCAATVTLMAAGPAAAAQDDYGDERAQMVEVVQQHAKGAASALDGEELDPKVLEAMGTVPRHEFVPEEHRGQAYADRPLPIGYGQTISQPFIVGLMTDLLEVDEDDIVLEIGTGSAYQAAVLSPLADKVYSIEIVPGLGEAAAERLERLEGFDNVETKVADGYYGWPEAGPFDGIVVTAAASHVPPPLVEQLKPGGRMIIPVGGPFSQQQLMLVEKQEDGKITTRQLLPVQFVPFTGGQG